MRRIVFLFVIIKLSYGFAVGTPQNTLSEGDSEWTNKSFLIIIGVFTSILAAMIFAILMVLHFKGLLCCSAKKVMESDAEARDVQHLEDLSKTPTPAEKLQKIIEARTSDVILTFGWTAVKPKILPALLLAGDLDKSDFVKIIGEQNGKKGISMLVTAILRESEEDCDVFEHVKKDILKIYFDDGNSRAVVEGAKMTAATTSKSTAEEKVPATTAASVASANKSRPAIKVQSTGEYSVLCRANSPPDHSLYTRLEVYSATYESCSLPAAPIYSEVGNVASTANVHEDRIYSNTDEEYENVSKINLH